MNGALMGALNIFFLAFLTALVVLHAYETDRSPLFWGLLTFLFHVFGATAYALYCLFDDR